MRERDVGSGGAAENTILFAAGCLMSLIGVGLLYFAYKIAVDGNSWPYENLVIVVFVVLSYFLLRGAWYTVIAEDEEPKGKLLHDKRK